MDVLEQRYLNTDLNFMYKVLQFGNNPVRLVGTGSIASQYYPADFDFLSLIRNKYNYSQVYKNFKKIFEKIYQSPNLFFIEFKLQKFAKEGKDPEKHKVFDMNKIDERFFEAYFNKDVELCKIDAIIYLNNNTFKEVSCIYFFGESGDKITFYENMAKSILADQKHYYDDGKYYKSLKRLMLSTKYEAEKTGLLDRNLIITITSFFNSYVGKLYELDNQIQAAIIFMNKYKDKNAQQRIKYFIRHIGLGDMNPDKLEEVSKEYQKIINGEALKFYKKFNLPVGHLPKWNSIRLY
jgi:predicted ATP-grasp superfamily ATP-dependent carboligase